MHGSGRYLAGQGTNLAGGLKKDTKRKLGEAFIELGQEAHDEGTTLGKLGHGILAGIGSVLVRDSQQGSGKSRARSLMNDILNSAEKVRKQAGGSYGSKASLKKTFEKYKDTPLYAKDIFGKDWKRKTRRIKSLIDKASKDQLGSGIWGDIKQAGKQAGNFFKDTGKQIVKKSPQAIKSAVHVTKEFLDGNLAVKPSHIMYGIAGVVGAATAASALIPGVDLVSVPLGSYQTLKIAADARKLQTEGRGLPKCKCDFRGCDCQKGGNIFGDIEKGVKKGFKSTKKELKKIPQRAKKNYKNIPKDLGMEVYRGVKSGPNYELFASNLATGKKSKGNWATVARGVVGAGIVGDIKKAGKKAQKRFDDWDFHGKGMHGQKKLPPSIQKFVDKKPLLAKKIVTLAKKHKRQKYKHGQKGRGWDKWEVAAGIGTTVAALGAAGYGLYQLFSGDASGAETVMSAGAPLMPGSGKTRKIKNIKAIKTKIKPQPRQYGLPPGVSMTGSGRIKKDKYSVWHGYYPKTSSGLTKKDLMQKGHKIISKRKHAMGKRLKQEGRGIFK